MNEGPSDLHVPLYCITCVRMNVCARHWRVSFDVCTQRSFKIEKDLASCIPRMAAKSLW